MDVPRAPPGWSAGASSLATSAPFGSGTDIFILCGKWYDSNGSKYVVDKNKFDQLDVTTERPDGSRIHTSRLIRLEGGNVHWGSHYVLDVNDDVKNALDELRVGHPGVLRTFRWLSKEGKPAFVWKRQCSDVTPQGPRELPLLTKNAPDNRLDVSATWGEPHWFYWIQPYNTHYCRLCWKYVDDKHISSREHRRNQRQADERLEHWRRDPLMQQIRKGLIDAWIPHKTRPPSLVVASDEDHLSFPQSCTKLHEETVMPASWTHGAGTIPIVQPTGVEPLAGYEPGRNASHQGASHRPLGSTDTTSLLRGSTRLLPSPPALPCEVRAAWGEPHWFYWIQPYSTHYCRLCWKYVDDKHISSRGHLRNCRQADERLEHWRRDPLMQQIRQKLIHAWILHATGPPSLVIAPDEDHLSCRESCTRLHDVTVMPASSTPGAGSTPKVQPTGVATFTGNKPEGNASQQGVSPRPWVSTDATSMLREGTRLHPWPPAPPSEAPQSSVFDGVWILGNGAMAVIKDFALHWDRAVFKLTSGPTDNSIKVDILKCTFTADRKHNNATDWLQWSNGDIWRRPPCLPDGRILAYSKPSIPLRTSPFSM